MPQSTLPTDWVPVASTNVSRFRYWPAEKWLDVEFLAKPSSPASRYRYSGVPEDVFLLFQMAGSKGQFVWQNLRGKYPYQRI